MNSTIYDKHGTKYILDSEQLRIIDDIDRKCRKFKPGSDWLQNYYVIVRIGQNNSDGHQGLIYSNFSTLPQTIRDKFSNLTKTNNLSITYGRCQGFNVEKIINERNWYLPKLSYRSIYSNFLLNGS